MRNASDKYILTFLLTWYLLLGGTSCSPPLKVLELVHYLLVSTKNFTYDAWLFWVGNFLNLSYYILFRTEDSIIS